MSKLLKRLILQLKKTLLLHLLDRVVVVNLVWLPWLKDSMIQSRERFFSVELISKNLIQDGTKHRLHSLVKNQFFLPEQSEKISAMVLTLILLKMKILITLVLKLMFLPSWMIKQCSHKDMKLFSVKEELNLVVDKNKELQLPELLFVNLKFYSLTKLLQH